MHFSFLSAAAIISAGTVVGFPQRNNALANLFRRDSPDNTCGNTGAGNNNGYSCNTTTTAYLCCSAAGYCGDTEAHCSVSQGCQSAFGTCGWAGDDEPPEYDTSGVSRTQVGSIPYSPSEIYDCNVAGTVALTFDDGPYIYTEGLLDLLDEFGAKATFFITGDNIDKGAISDSANGWDVVINDTYSRGHQIASHTWTHPDLSNLTADGIKEEMYRLESALVGIIGRFPTYMRPPYSSCSSDSECPSTLSELGYHIAYFDLDTDDYDNTTPDLIQNAKNIVTAAFNGSSNATDNFLSIAHDIHEQSATNLTRFELETLYNAGFRAVTLGECLGDPEENWYRIYTNTTSSASSAAAATATQATFTAAEASTTSAAAAVVSTASVADAATLTTTTAATAAIQTTTAAAGAPAGAEPSVERNSDFRSGWKKLGLDILSNPHMNLPGIHKRQTGSYYSSSNSSYSSGSSSSSTNTNTTTLDTTIDTTTNSTSTIISNSTEAASNSTSHTATSSSRLLTSSSYNTTASTTRSSAAASSSGNRTMDFSLSVNSATAATTSQSPTSSSEAGKVKAGSMALAGIVGWLLL